MDDATSIPSLGAKQVNDDDDDDDDGGGRLDDPWQSSRGCLPSSAIPVLRLSPRPLMPPPPSSQMHPVYSSTTGTEVEERRRAEASAGTENSLPCILACGQRSVRIVKSSLLFPAWLVRLVPSSNGSGPDRDPMCSSFVLVWRTKRDFQRLGRAATRSCFSSCSSSRASHGQERTIAFPRAALDKLARGAPWTRPLDDKGDDFDNCVIDADRREGENSSGSSTRRIAPINERSDHDPCWDPRWTKSLRRLDQFLQRIHLLCFLHHRHRRSSRLLGSVSSKGDGSALSWTAHPEMDLLSAAWDEFCRPENAENVVPVVFYSHAEHGGEGEEGVGADFDDEGCGGGWIVDVESDNNSNPLARDPRHRSEVDAERRGNDLGQYYCSEESADRLVRLFLDESRRWWSDGAVDGPRSPPRGVVVVEPTCGDGRLLQRLGEALQEPSDAPWILNRESLGSRLRFVGMDVDGFAVDRAVVRLRPLTEADEPCFFPDIRCITTDFLLSRRLECEALVGIGRSGAEMKSDRGKGVSLSREDATTGPTFLVIGGPPYTAGAGSTVSRSSTGPAMGLGLRAPPSSLEARQDFLAAQRSLPLRFVRHAIVEYGAEVICFLMPERCRRCPQLRQLLDRHAYECTTLDCDSIFYFQGKADRPVRQPSVLQCYRKRA